MQNWFRRPFFYFAVSLLLGLLMVSNQSLWIDETQTAIYARMPTFHDWQSKLMAATTSEVQMPLSMFLAWIAGKTIGVSERQLRLPNVAWVGLAGLAIGLIGRRVHDWRLFPLFIIHPFLWYYANEARPYALQIAAGCWLLYGVIRAHQSTAVSAVEWSIIGISAVVGYGTHFLFGFPLAGSILWLFLIYKGSKAKFSWNVKNLAVFGFAICVLAILTIYYSWTILRGAAGARIWTLSPLNLVFALYEALGFGGVGPPRHELRDLIRSQGAGAIISQLEYFAICLPLTSACFAILIYIIKRRADPILNGSMWVIVFASLGLYVASTVVHFPFWGRHLSALLPFFVLVISRSLRDEDCSKRNVTRRIILLVFICSWGFSSLNLRFNPRHGKDDYRSASALAKNFLASRKTIWWAADEFTADYYGITRNQAASRQGSILFVRNPSAELLKSFPTPDYIFVSKPDVHDSGGNVRRKIADLDFRKIKEFTAFTVWGL